MKTIIRICLVILLLLAGISLAQDDTAPLADQLSELAQISPPPQLSDREIGTHIVPCGLEQTLDEPEIEGETYQCGVFTVPLNWDDPDGGKIDIFFRLIKASGENPTSDVMVYLSGGPGQGGVMSSSSKYLKLRDERDLLFLDQRGTAYSQRLGYEECMVLLLQNGGTEDQIKIVSSGARNLVTDARAESEDVLDFGAVNQVCWEQFTNQGIDPAQFTTVASARDVVELVSALEYDTFNLHGISYGTRLAMTIMDMMPEYPDAPELRSVVLDSTFPPSVYLVSSEVRSSHDFMLQLLGECQADVACNEAYPNLVERLSMLLASIETTPLTVGEETIIIDDLVDVLTNVDSTHARYFPKMITELETGVIDTYVGLRDGVLGNEPAERFIGEDLDLNDPIQKFFSDAFNIVGDLSVEDWTQVSVNLQALMVQDDPITNVSAFVEATFTGEVKDLIITALAQIDEEDIANSPYIIAFVKAISGMQTDPDPQAKIVNSRQILSQDVSKALYNSIHCTEDIQFETMDDVLEVYNSLQFPQFVDLNRIEAFFRRCENWPVQVASPDVKDPVTSNVLTLVIQGAYDKPTPVYMGELAHNQLDNSVYVLVPQQGHEVWSFATNCIGSISSAFVQNPDAELDTACLDDRQPQWVLPDGS